MGIVVDLIYQAKGNTIKDMEMVLRLNRDEEIELRYKRFENGVLVKEGLFRNGNNSRARRKYCYICHYM